MSEILTYIDGGGGRGGRGNMHWHICRILHVHIFIKYLIKNLRNLMHIYLKCSVLLAMVFYATIYHNMIEIKLPLNYCGVSRIAYIRTPG